MTTLTQISFFDEPQPEVEEIPLPVGHSCRACGAQITWERTKNGKPIPLDLALHWCSPNGSGRRLFLIRDDGVSAQGFECKPSAAGAQCGRVTHFSTCPKAEEFRR